MFSRRLEETFQIWLYLPAKSPMRLKMCCRKVRVMVQDGRGSIYERSLETTNTIFSCKEFPGLIQLESIWHGASSEPGVCVCVCVCE